MTSAENELMSDQASPEFGLARAAREVAILAAQHADQAEQERLIHPEVARAVVANGFTRHFVPVSNGGNAGTFSELSAALVTVGTHCPATAWCASIAANLARMAAYLPEEGRKEVWRDGPDTFVVGAVSPKGKAVPEEDGWRLSGSWSYISAVDHSEWALVLGIAQVDGAGEPRLFALPRSDYRVEPTWSDIGMRATGSNTLVVEDVFVPSTLSVVAKDLLEGNAPEPAANCHSVPLPAVNGLSFCLPMLGAAEGALEHWSTYAESRIRTCEAAPGPGPGRGFYEETLARSSGEIDAAGLLLDRVAAVADRGAISPQQTARSQRDCALAADLLVSAVDRLFRASGTGGHSESSPLQRWWRDIHSAAGHIVLQFGPAAAAYARRMLDV
ncbi:acyl-CoA dehydrogenase family protein [Amycolatopsis palatopharyngis]|uniref:acyl-CoA dehydrogenase family protein n=1 Tax=Amycolatopsis palatopharyngis TaxID=187982 RepID=UPI001FEA7962|nr:acyl-CoA dehydrogenase family protein [Amycolatopsis palatopharyngis]